MVFGEESRVESLEGVAHHAAGCALGTFTAAFFVVEHGHHVDELLVVSHSIFTHETLQSAEGRVQVVDSAGVDELVEGPDDAGIY